jgi:hypothetical protein
MVKPAVEKTCSDGARVAGMNRYLMAKSLNNGTAEPSYATSQENHYTFCLLAAKPSLALLYKESTQHVLFHNYLPLLVEDFSSALLFAGLFCLP